MDTITLTLNGNTISAREGKTILEVARDQGIYIPTLCHHDALRPIGACRLCQVEDRKRGVVVPACVTKIAPGIVIDTDSERISRNRKNIIRLLMAAHPESCLVCEKGNRCELRNLAARMGVAGHGLDSMPYHPGVVDLNPFLSRDLSKCIMCAKCVRADQEVVCEGVIDYNLRGFDAYPATLLNQALEESSCTFCGTCLNVCPTGAIAEKDKYRLDHPGARTRSVCSFCACGCSIYVEHDRMSVRGVSPFGENNTSNGISLCVKGHFGHDYVNSKDRLQTPLVRTDDGFEPVGWDEALDMIAEKLGRISESHGPESLAFMGSARGSNEENYLFQKLARESFKTNNIDFGARAAWAPVYEALEQSTGFCAGTSSFKDVESSDVILVIGADPTKTAPVLGYHVKRAAQKGSKIIVVDPVKTSLVSRSEVWLRPRIATDSYLLSALIKVIIEEELLDRHFVVSKTREYESLVSSMEGLNLKKALDACGVEEEDVRKVARLFCGSQSGFIVFGNGLAGQAGAKDLAGLVIALSLLSGNIGKDKAGLMPVLKEANAQGALDMGICPDRLPGRKSLDDGPALEMLSGVWESKIPDSPGLDALNMISAAEKGDLKGLYVFCENPAAVMPDAGRVLKALQNVEFLVVQDMFLTETAKLADLVIPSTAWAEKSGTASNMERRIQYFKKAVISPGGFPEDWEIFCALARRLGKEWKYGSPEEVLTEIEKVVPLYSDVTAVISGKEPFFWPRPGLEHVSDTLPHGIGHDDGKAVFLPPGPAGPGLDDGTDMPFIMVKGNILQHIGGGSRTSRSRRLEKAAPGVFLGISTADLDRLQMKSGDQVRVFNELDAIELPAMADDRLPEGIIFMPSSFREASPAKLFKYDWDETGKTFNNKHCRVGLEKIDGPSE